MVRDEGIVSTGGRMDSPHPLQVTATSQKRAGGPTNIEPSVGEQTTKRPALSPSVFSRHAGANRRHWSLVE